MAEILTKKVWRVKDIIRTEGTQDIVSILKISHPFRQQRITIVPAPRYAVEEYYTDWVYQPYVKDHIMYASNDIYNPFYVFYCRYLLKRNRFPAYAYFHPMGLPDCIEVNMSRREFLKRELPLKTPLSTILLTTNSFRDKHHPWVPRKVLGIVGENYVVHPRKEKQSLVFVVPPAYVPDIVNTLQGVGFQVTESATAPIGETETLQRLERWSRNCQWVALAYLWFLIALFIVGESRHVNELFQDYKREMVEKAGKDPKAMGL